MGLLVETSFATPEGFLVSSVYCRITSFAYSFVSRDLTIHYECYLDREKRLAGCRALYVPGISAYTNVPHSDLPTLTDLYTNLKAILTEASFVALDVFEPGQEPPIE
jgi:hypothetical protein